jgi:hypothetical protein
MSKFNRMGYLAGFGDRTTVMVRGGICDRRGTLMPESFAATVHEAGYSETWSEGLFVFHNPMRGIRVLDNRFPIANLILGPCQKLPELEERLTSCQRG